MSRPKVMFLFFCLAFGFAFIGLAQAQGGSAVCEASDLDVPPVECAALLQFYESTGGSSWTMHEGWGESTAVCSWTGVECGSISGATHVTALVLQSNNLNGPLPPSLGSLPQLTTLDLFDNYISGTIPAGLGTLGQLTYLDLGLNLIEGTIPFPLTASSAPFFLFLDGNRLSGPLPAGYCGANLASATARYNMLDVAGTDACFDGLGVFADWDLTQTVPPQGVSAVLDEVTAGTGAQATASASIELSWTPIPFASGSGGYAIFSGPSTLGPFATFHGQVNSKAASSTIIEVQGDPQSYVFVVRSFSAPGARNKSALLSTESNTTRVEGVALTLLATEAGSPALYLALLGPLVLLLITAVAAFAARRRPTDRSIG